MSTSSIPKTIIKNNPYITLDNQGQTLKPMELKDKQHILGRDTRVADLAIPESWATVSRCQAVFRKLGNEYYIYDGDGNKPSSNRLFINNTLITPKDGHLLKDGEQIKIGQNPKDWIIINYHDDSFISKIPTPKQQSLSLKNKSVMLGRDSSANLQLEAPTVSGKHAVIDTDKQGRYVITDYSTNGIFVDGQKVQGSSIINLGATIKIGPYTFVLQQDKLILADRGNNIRLDAVNLVRKVKDKKGQSKIIINDISFPIEPGQFVGLVGGSGAGKSTLMRTLLGIEPTTQGMVYLNGENLRKNFNIYRNQIGYVPQRDIVHRELTVAEVLYYAAKLRLPNDVNESEIINKTLQQIDMIDFRDVLAKNLSGGQLKRVSIGVELLADPKLFFLDEPTSGLDPGLDKKMMQLLRNLADQGRTIILVTHATSNIDLCDRLAFLGRGGHLCYYGTPQQAPDFFEIKSHNFADIYISLETTEAVVRETRKFKQSNQYKDYVADRLFHNNEAMSQKTPQKVKPSLIQQIAILTERYAKIVFRDRINLALSLLTAPIGISLIKLAIGDQNPLVLGTEEDSNLFGLALKVLFVFTCANIWVGLSSSLQEIVKEIDIYWRERLVNLGIFSYLNSKLLILGLLSLCQTILISIVILIGFKSPSPELIPWYLGLFITCFLTIFTSNNLGLMVSASFKNSSQANSALPLLLIPQIIFSGVLFKMEGIGKYISWLMLSRWSVGAYGILVNVNEMIPEPITLFDGTEIPQPFEPSPVYEVTWQNLGLNWGILLLHIAVYFCLTLWLQKRKDV